jgi:hypothetical protein
MPDEEAGERRTSHELPSQPRPSPALAKSYPEPEPAPKEVSATVPAAHVAVERVAPAAPAPPSLPAAPVVSVRRLAANPAGATLIESGNENVRPEPRPLAPGKSAPKTAEQAAAGRMGAPLPSPRSQEQVDHQSPIKVQQPAQPHVPAQPALPRPLARPPLESTRRDRPARPPEPVVQVTIGRIEIRATSDQEPRRKERAASPVMSLDEYLKTRAGGGRR